MARKKTLRQHHSAQQVRRQLRAKKLFTNRHEERELIAQFLHDIASKDRAPSKPILSFYGVGGVGKSALLSCAWDEFHAANPDSNITQIHLDIDSDKAEAMSITEMLWSLRMQIYHQTKASLLAFDFLYLKYMEKANEKVSLNDGPVRKFFESIAEKKSGSLSSVLRGIGTMIEVFPVSNMISRGFTHLKARDKEKELIKLLDIDLESLDEWRAGDIERKLPCLLAEDLGLFITESKMSLVFVIDGYERILKKTERAFVEDFVATLLLDEQFGPQAGMILLGRERTNWAAYDDPLDTFRWNDSFIAHRHLLGLNASDAEQYLSAATALYQTEGSDELAEALQLNSKAILQACRESTTDASQQSYHPFYLDICLESLESHGLIFNAACHLGKTPKELMNRFFCYMDQNELSLHVALALAVEFDWNLIFKLQQKNVIPPLTQSDFLQFANSHSYVLKSDQKDNFYFGRLIHESLKTYVLTVDDTHKYALRESVLTALIEYYDEYLSPTEADCDADELMIMRMYARANQVLMCAAESGLLSLEDAFAQHLLWAEYHSSDFFKLRTFWDRQWAKSFKQHYGLSHKKTHPAMQQWMKSIDDMLRVGQSLLSNKKYLD